MEGLRGKEHRLLQQVNLAWSLPWPCACARERLPSSGAPPSRMRSKVSFTLLELWRWAFTSSRRSSSSAFHEQVEVLRGSSPRRNLGSAGLIYPELSPLIQLPNARELGRQWRPGWRRPYPLATGTRLKMAAFSAMCARGFASYTKASGACASSGPGRTIKSY